MPPLRDLRRLAPASALLFALLFALPGAPLAGPGPSAPELWILHVNDVHGHFAPARDGTGGAAVLATALRDLRRRALRRRTPVLTVHAGDLFQGTALVNADRGAQVVPLLRDLRFHLGVPGNHEWDYGAAAFRRLVEAPRPLLLSTSIAGLPDAVWERLVTTVGGVRVGLVGYTLPSTPARAPEGATQGLTFRAGPRALRPVVEGLRARGVACVILVSHTDPEEDFALARSLDLDLVVGGHSNDVAPPRRIPGSSAWYAQAGHHLRHLGWLRLRLDPTTGRLAGVSGEVLALDPDRWPPDAAVAARIEDLRQATAGPGADLRLHLDRALSKGAWSGPSPLVALAAHALREGAGADLALLNAGACRVHTLGPREVGFEEVYAAYPYENRVSVVEISGAALDELYEGLCRAGFRRFTPAQRARFASAGWPLEDGWYLDDYRGLPQPSGFRVRVDPHAPAGDRVALLAPDGAPLPLDQRYRLATSDYLAAGGDDYPLLADRPRRTLDVRVRDLVLARLAERGARAPEGPGCLVNLSFRP